MVFELLETDLLETFEALHLTARPPSQQQIRWLGREVLAGLDAVHSRGIIHRDIKPENIMLCGPSHPDGAAAKLVDFGQAKDTRTARAKRRDWTAYVATRWYRAPELLLGAARYSPAVDVWAAGLVLAEAAAGRPVFPGSSPHDQLFKIASTLGPPQATWPGAAAVAAAAGVTLPATAGAGAGLAQLLPPGTAPALLEALGSMLQWDPSRRPSAAACLSLPFFASGVASPLAPARPPGRVVDAAGGALRARAAADAQTRLEGLAAASAAASASGAGLPASGPGAGAAGADSDTDEEFHACAKPAAAVLDAGRRKPGAKSAAISTAAAAGSGGRRKGLGLGLGLASVAGRGGGGSGSGVGSLAGLGNTLGSILAAPVKIAQPMPDDEGVVAAAAADAAAAAGDGDELMEDSDADGRDAAARDEDDGDGGYMPSFG